MCKRGRIRSHEDGFVEVLIEKDTSYEVIKEVVEHCGDYSIQRSKTDGQKKTICYVGDCVCFGMRNMEQFEKILFH